MELYDAFTVDGVRRTADGYLAAFARVARTGVQVYRGAELGRPDLDSVRVYRPPEEVFHADALRSFAHRPVTLRHPTQPVNARNWKQHAGGQTGDEVVRDGEFVRVPMVMMDQRLIDAYERDGTRELSMGYSTDIKWRTGVTDAGEPYDAVQTAIRGNHLAVVPIARGGDQLRIGDADLSAAGRRSAAKSGAAMPDGSFPIESAEDVSHAVEDWGRAGSSPAVKSHIIKRARALGAEKNLPSTWTADAMSTKTCPECGAKVSSDATECPECGYDLTDDNIKDSTGDYPMKLTLDGLTVNVADDQSGAIIEKHIASLQKQLADAAADLENFKKKKKEDDEEAAEAKKTNDAKDGEIAVLKKQVADAAITPQVLDALVKARTAVTDRAKVLLGDKYVFADKTVEQIRKDAVLAKLGDAAKDMNDGAIEGAFAALTADAKTIKADAQIAAAIVNRPHTVTGDGAVETRDAAFDGMEKRLQDAWKTPARAS